MKFHIGDQAFSLDTLQAWANSETFQTSDGWAQEIRRSVQEWFDPSDYITIRTSGSTGKPKLIRLAKDQMRISALKTAERFGLVEGMMSLNCLPSQYIAGKMMLIRALVIGMDQICIQPKLALSFSRTVSIDFAAMTPMQVFHTVRAHPKSVDRIQTLILGGGPITNEISALLQKLNTSCFATYGMTETITHVAIAPANGPHRSPVFKGLNGIQFSIKEDCLVIEADHLEHPVETTDRVELLDENHFKWIGRMDNVINSGGVKIQAESVERDLDRWIEDRFFISGIPDSISGQKVVLVIESEPYDGRGLQFLKEKINLLDPIERPKRIVFAERLQETDTGKILRNPGLYMKV